MICQNNLQDSVKLIKDAEENNPYYQFLLATKTPIQDNFL